VLSKAVLIPQLHVGTANFGSRYGISSKEALSSREIEKILFYAENNNLIIDTADNYPGSHFLIGSSKLNLNIATKFDLRKYTNYHDLYNAIKRAKADLRTDTLAVAYLRGSDLQFDEVEKEMVNNLVANRESLGISELGFSIYEVSELTRIEDHYGNNFTFQVPYNLANTSFRSAIEIHKQNKSKTKFVARSIFLQGLLTLPEEDIPAELGLIAPLREWISTKAREDSCSNMEICLGFVAKSSLFDGMVIGVQSLSQLEECRSLLDVVTFQKPIDFGNTPTVSAAVYDPRNWGAS
jgi:aryl-alcohol dehydrogenase-like predicted oxidoreductase